MYIILVYRCKRGVKMAKIIKIEDNTVYIGTNDNKIVKVRKDSINWDIKVGENVDIYESDDEMIISRRVDRMSSSIDPYAPERHKVNKVAYAVCAFLLGSFGVQKFLAGKVGTGLLCLLFCWTIIPGIIGIVGGIIACTMKADSNGYILV